jgi:tetratricopeptide (TPR) repeat protein
MIDYESNTKSQILAKETLLATVKEEKARFELLQDLINYYIFTDLKKAKNYLDEQLIIVELNAINQYSIDYFTNRALLSNQVYNYEQSELDYLHVINLFSETNNKIESKIEVYLDIAAVCQNLKKTSEADKYLRIATKLLEKTNNKLLNLYCQTRWAMFYYEFDLSKAIEYLLDLEILFGQNQEELPIKGIYFQTVALSALGRIYENQDNIEKALEVFFRTIELCEKYELKSRLSYHYLNIGNALLRLDDIERAEFYYQKSINILDDISQTARSRAYSNLGKCRFTKGDFIQGLAYLTHAKNLLKESNKDDYFNLSVVENYFAEFYSITGKDQKMFKCLERALRYAEKSQNQNQIGSICNNLAQHYFRKKKFEEAFLYKDKYEQALILNNKQRSADEIEKIKLFYELDKKQQEADLERMKAISLQNKALRAQMNPHFMFNLLNAIQAYVNAGDADKAANYLAKFASLMRESLDYSDKEYITLEDEIDFLRNYLDLNQKLRFENRLDYRIEIDDEVEPDWFEVPSMIVQPYVENAIEHGLKSIQNGFLTLHINMYDDNNIICIVEDNGVGRKLAGERKAASRSLSKHRSMGTSITEARLKLLHESAGQADWEFIKTIDLFTDGNPAGTRVEIIIPIADNKKI